VLGPLVTDNRPRLRPTSPAPSGAALAGGTARRCSPRDPKGTPWACPRRRLREGLIALQDRAHAADLARHRRAPATGERRTQPRRYAFRLEAAVRRSLARSRKRPRIQRRNPARHHLTKEADSAHVRPKQLPDADQDQPMRIWPVGRRAEGPGAVQSSFAVV